MLVKSLGQLCTIVRNENYKHNMPYKNKGVDMIFGIIKNSLPLRKHQRLLDQNHIGFTSVRALIHREQL